MYINLHRMFWPTSLFSFLLFALHLSAPRADSVSFMLVNQCNYSIWPASLTTSGNEPLPTVRYPLKQRSKLVVRAPKNWTGRFWARTNCKGDSLVGNLSCTTGDCGTGKLSCDDKGAVPPATVAEFRLGVLGSPGSNGTTFAFYDVSMVDGFNVPIFIVPLSGSGEDCSSRGCRVDQKEICPTELKVIKKERVVGCQAACVRNHSTTQEACDYSVMLKRVCPHQAYSYPYENRTLGCSSMHYRIIFCPTSTNGSSESLDQEVNVGDSLIAGNGTRWLSPSGDFALGFYRLPSELFLLAIWYDKIPDKTIIWYANRDNPAARGSRLELNYSRGLVLSNPQGLELWRSNFTSGTIFNGLMSDYGNFQLRGIKFDVLWDTFSHPTDTLVPNQVIELNGNLSSRQGEFNFSHGRFKLHLQEDGNVVLKLINFPSNYSPYYSTKTSDAKNTTSVGQRLVLDKLGFLYVEEKNGKRIYISEPNATFSTDDFYSKATINYDGVFTLSYYPKDSKKEQSWIVARTIPQNICLYSSFTGGEGICGFNSICTLQDDQRPNCTCPDGYSLIDSNNTYGGCIPNYPVICQASGHLGPQGDPYTMKELPNTEWPKSDYEILSSSSLQECKKSCLKDCLCVLASFNKGSCWKKKFPLSYGRKDPGLKGISVMKLMKNDSFSVSSFANVKKDHDTLIFVLTILLGISVFIILTLVGSICFRPYNRKKIKSSRTNKSVVDNDLNNFTFKEIVEATNNFKEELGRGSCSIVYKGTIYMTSVAVKKLDKLIQDSDKEFQTEMSVIGKTHHRNLVRLLGYCKEGQHRILVYELMSNGTLASFIFTPLKPNWNQRVDIALGIARGLVYLHEGCCTQIIHCDIKAQNILLDDRYNARISDFGLSKLLLINQSHTETRIRGTKGYIAPDWFRSAPVTTKVDTYSFGVLLLEIICCRKNVEKEFVSEEKGILTDWAYDCYKAKRLDILLGNDQEAINDMRSFEKFVMIAIWCIQEDPSIRPTMKEVLLMLEGITDVVIPPSPYLYGSLSCN